MDFTIKNTHRRALSQMKAEPSSFKLENNFISIKKFNPIEYSNKISLKIKVPKVTFDKKNLEKQRFYSDSPLRNLVKLVHPKSINDTMALSKLSKKSLLNFSPVKKKLVHLALPEKVIKINKFIKETPSKPEFLPPLKTTFGKKLKTDDKNTIYFELLGFFIKKRLDYNQIYKEIDGENKG